MRFPFASLVAFPLIVPGILLKTDPAVVVEGVVAVGETCVEEEVGVIEVALVDDVAVVEGVSDGLEVVTPGELTD